MLQIPKGKEAVLPYSLARIYTYTHKRSHTHIIQYIYIYMHLGTHIRAHKHTHTKWSWTSARDFCFNACLTSSVLNRFSLFRLKIECEKLASEKTEMQRHYVMVRHFVSSSSCFFIFVSSTAYSRQLKTSLRWRSGFDESSHCYRALLRVSLEHNVSCDESCENYQYSIWKLERSKAPSIGRERKM